MKEIFFSSPCTLLCLKIPYPSSLSLSFLPFIFLHSPPLSSHPHYLLFLSFSSPCLSVCFFHRYDDEDTRCQLLSLITPRLAAFKIQSKPIKNLDLNSVFTRGSDTGYGVPYENALYVPAREGYNDGKYSQKHKAMYKLTHNLSETFLSHYYYFLSSLQ